MYSHPSLAAATSQGHARAAAMPPAVLASANLRSRGRKELAFGLASPTCMYSIPGSSCQVSITTFWELHHLRFSSLSTQNWSALLKLSCDPSSNREIAHTLLEMVNQRHSRPGGEIERSAFRDLTISSLRFGWLVQ